jgi:hypothetical protein
LSSGLAEKHLEIKLYRLKVSFYHLKHSDYVGFSLTSLSFTGGRAGRLARLPIKNR